MNQFSPPVEELLCPQEYGCLMGIPTRDHWPNHWTIVPLQTKIGPENLRWHGLGEWLWSYSIHNDISGWQELPQCAKDQAIAHLQTKTVPQNLRWHGLAQTHGSICNSIQSRGGLATKSMERSYVYWQKAYCTVVILVVLSLWAVFSAQFPVAGPRWPFEEVSPLHKANGANCLNITWLY